MLLPHTVSLEDIEFSLDFFYTHLAVANPKNDNEFATINGIFFKVENERIQVMTGKRMISWKGEVEKVFDDNRYVLIFGWFLVGLFAVL